MEIDPLKPVAYRIKGEAIRRARIIHIPQFDENLEGVFFPRRFRLGDVGGQGVEIRSRYFAIRGDFPDVYDVTPVRPLPAAYKAVKSGLGLGEGG